MYGKGRVEGGLHKAGCLRKRGVCQGVSEAQQLRLGHPDRTAGPAPPILTEPPSIYPHHNSSQIVVSLVLGFMLVWDMPSISSGMATLRNSRLAPFYNEVAPVLSVFGKLFGKALEAQVGLVLVECLVLHVCHEWWDQCWDALEAQVSSCVLGGMLGGLPFVAHVLVGREAG